MKKVTLAIACAALTFSTLGMAASYDSKVAPDNSSYPTGIYVTGSAGYGKTDSRGPVKNSGFVWNAGAGYRFNKYIAVETGYMRLPRVKGMGVKIYPNLVYLVAKGIYPINETFDVFAKAGAGYVWTSSKPSNMAILGSRISPKAHLIVPVFGLGADYNISQNLAVTVQGVTTIKSGHTIPTTYAGLAGLTYSFG